MLACMQRRRVLRLVAEPLGEDLLVVRVGPHDLHRDLALQDVVEATPDVGHAPGGDLLLQHVAVAETETFHESLHGACPTSLRDRGTRLAPQRRCYAPEASHP